MPGRHGFRPARADPCIPGNARADSEARPDAGVPLLSIHCLAGIDGEKEAKNHCVASNGERADTLANVHIRCGGPRTALDGVAALRDRAIVAHGR